MLFFSAFFCPLRSLFPIKIYITQSTNTTSSTCNTVLLSYKRIIHVISSTKLYIFQFILIYLYSGSGRIYIPTPSSTTVKKNPRRICLFSSFWKNLLFTMTSYAVHACPPKIQYMCILQFDHILQEKLNIFY